MKKAGILCLILSFFAVAPTYAQTDVIYEVFNSLDQDYINTVTPKEISLQGLKALNSVDENLSIEQNDKEIILILSDKAVQNIPFPSESADIQTWVDWCHNVLKTAENISQKVSIHDFEMPDKFAQSAIESMDGYSHYFSTFTNDFDENKPFKVRRSFASRIVDDYLLIRLLTFQKGSTEKIQTAVTECSKCKGLILDLRGNHGGFLQEALSIANLFLDEGIMTYTLSEKNEPQYYTANAGDILNGKPIVILADGLSASAAEVLTGALYDQNRAVFIGTKTYGKGTVQDVKKMDSDRAISVTISYFYTPSGLKIDKTGITPQICIGTQEDCSPEDRFKHEEDIERAVQYLKTGI